MKSKLNLIIIISLLCFSCKKNQRENESKSAPVTELAKSQHPKVFKTSVGSAISKKEAQEWIAAYAREYCTDKTRDSRSIFYGREIIQQILKQEDVTGISFFLASRYSELAQKNIVHLVLVGTKENGIQLWPSNNDDNNSNGEEKTIVDNGVVCPPLCPGDQRSAEHNAWLFKSSVGNSISIKKAKEWISTYDGEYRKDKTRDTKSIFYGRNIIEQILNQNGVTGINFFFASRYNDQAKKNIVQLVLVGAKGDGTLLWPTDGGDKDSNEERGVVVDNGMMCPPACPEY